MHHNHNIFVQAVKRRRKIKLIFHCEEDGNELSVSCAPMDYKPGQRATDVSEYYYFWCSPQELYPFEADKTNHVLRLEPGKIIGMELSEEKFDPTEFGNVDINWYLPPKLWRFNPFCKFFTALGHRFRKSEKSPGNRRTKR